VIHLTTTDCSQLCKRCRAGNVNFKLKVTVETGHVDVPIHSNCGACGAEHVYTVLSRTSTSVTVNPVLIDLPTLGEEFNRAEADGYGKLFEGGPGVLEVGIVRGEHLPQLAMRVIVEEVPDQRRLFFVDPLSRQKGESVMTLVPLPPVGYAR
jgi:hypothetical protein